MVARAAYNHRAKFRDARTGTTYNYRRKNADVTKFMSGFPGTSQDLWNSVERAESALAFKPTKAQTAYSCIAGLPRELGRTESITAVVRLANWIRDSFGVVVDAVIHWDDRNPHMHLLFTQRTYDKATDTWSRKKTRAFIKQEGKDGLAKLREKAAEIFNERLSDLSTARVEHRSFAVRGVQRSATQHEGPRARYVRARLGISTDIHSRNLAASSAAQPTRTRKPPMKTKPATAKPTDTPVEVRDFWRDTARQLLAAATQPKRKQELADDDFQIVHDISEGRIAVAVCVDDDGERHFAIKPVGDPRNPSVGSPYFVHECAIPAPEAAPAAAQQIRNR